MKNPNGYGSIYKLKGNRRRPWIVNKTVKMKKVGKRYYQDREIIGYFESRAKAMAALAEYNKRTLGVNLDTTLEELYLKWSKTKYENVSELTKINYKSSWKHLHVLKNEKIVDIKKSQLQEVIDRLKNKGYGYDALHRIKIISKMMFNMALADDLIIKNYADLVELPKKERTEKEIFTDLEIKAINDLAKTNEWAKAISIMIYTGLRIGELLSLTKFNIDLDKKVITGGSKTKAGKNRIIPINDKIIEHIYYWYNTNSDYLINKLGGKINANTFREYFYYPTLKIAKIRRLTPHSTRHTFASLMSKSGANTAAIQKIIGHANYSTTANIYTHKHLDELRKAIDMI